MITAHWSGPGSVYRWTKLHRWNCVCHTCFVTIPSSRTVRLKRSEFIKGSDSNSALRNHLARVVTLEILVENRRRRFGEQALQVFRGEYF